MMHEGEVKSFRRRWTSESRCDSFAPMRFENLQRAIRENIATTETLLSQMETIESICEAVVTCLQRGGQLLTAGNGGSAAEALHMSEELVGRFRGNRRSLPAVALVADTTALTCIANDFGYDAVFSRQIEGLGREGDLLVVFSTSGNAVNLRRAIDAARAGGMQVVALLGRDGGALAGLADHELIVSGHATERIQEAHQLLLHMVLDAVERSFSE